MKRCTLFDEVDEEAEILLQIAGGSTNFLVTMDN